MRSFWAARVVVTKTESAGLQWRIVQRWGFAKLPGQRPSGFVTRVSMIPC
jgi:hypothetical protein